MQRHLLIGGLILLVVQSYESQENREFEQSITNSDLYREVSLLASDQMQGRLVSSPENAIAAEYIENRFESFGISPTSPTTGYRQLFNVTTVRLFGKNELAVKSNGKNKILTFSSDFFPEPFSDTGTVVGEPIFLGFGISAPKLHHDDYEDVDVTGKIVVALEHEPDEFDPQSQFHGVVASEYGRSRRKALEAQKRGAAAIVFVEDVHNHTPRGALTGLTPYIWPEQPRRTPRYQLSSSVNEIEIPAIRISSDQGEFLAQQTNQTLHDWASLSETKGGVAAIPIPNISLSLKTTVSRETTTVENIIGRIEGTDESLKNEAVIICAHFDHDGANGVQIFNGADDNASGVAGLVEIAEAYSLARKNGHRPRRSILLAAWNAEEQGLLGSWAYTLEPLIPLNNTAAVINMDMIGRNEEIPTDGGYRFTGLSPQTAESNENTVNVIGHSYSQDLRESLETANAGIDLDLKFLYDNNRSNLVRRSDQWPFLFHKIPSLFVHTGLHPDYHTERDTAEKLNYNKMARIVRLVYRTSWELATSNTPPHFN